MKKYYEVMLISKTVQKKYVLARNRQQAREIAEGEEWMEKEEMLDSEIDVNPADPEDYKGRIVLTKNGTIRG